MKKLIPDTPGYGDCCCCWNYNQNGDDICTNPKSKHYGQKMDAFDGCTLCDFSIESDLEMELYCGD